MEEVRTDEQLLTAACTEPEAFGAFYRRHLRAVLGFLVHRTRRPDLAADLAAETFAAALESLPRYRPSGSARGWLFAIAAHKLADSARHGRVVDQARRNLGMPVRELDDPDLERAEELLDAAALAADLEALLAGLPAEQRQALLARVVQEREYPDIAAELGCSEAVVRKRVSRGLVGMRRGLGESAP